ncbi:heavy-metal-associated domain-containing protein [Actinoplanes sp. NPDC049316]|uniref:heavy-metal-associated domain-containing protein n=1 Tax=Actinoplanes sp. NPDC049316 TaxID=3154727 RepID=UPI003435743E
MNDQLFSVPGISCGHCATAIRHEVGAVPGVRHVDVDLAGKTVRVTGGEERAIRAAIAEAGYEAA